MSLCSVCSTTLLPGKLCCVKCGGITIADSPGGTARDEDFIDVMDVEATAVSRIVTGEWWDEAFNGGFVPTFSMLLGGSPGAGKMLALDTPIPLANGTWKTMGEITVGDVVLDNVHRATRVVGRSDIALNRPCFELYFSSGSPITADADHLWAVDVGGPGERLVCTTTDIRGYLRQGRRVVLPEDRESFEKRRLIIGVFPTKSVAMRCISVDSPSRLYLAGRGMIPTHNTTWLLQVGAVVARVTKRPTYFISAEQDKGELKMTIDRLQLNLERGMFRVLKKMGSGGSIDEEIFKKEPPGMLILDSVTALCGKDKDAQVAVGRLYKQYSIKYRAPSFLISHMTKEGDLAGLLTLQHDVDAIASFFASDNERSRYYGMPALELHKYRFGPTHKEWQLIMTPLGLVRAPDEKLKKTDDVDDIIVQATKKAQERIVAEAMQRETDRRAASAQVQGQTQGQGQEMPKPAPLPALPPEPPTAEQRAKASRKRKSPELEGKRKTTSKEIRERKKTPRKVKETTKKDTREDEEELHLDESLLKALKATEPPTKSRRRMKPPAKTTKVKSKVSKEKVPVRAAARRR